MSVIVRHTRRYPNNHFDYTEYSGDLFTGYTMPDGTRVFENDIVQAKRGNTSLSSDDLYQLIWDDRVHRLNYFVIDSDNEWRVGKFLYPGNGDLFSFKNIIEII